VWERSVRATHHFLSEQDIVALRPQVAEELESGAYGWWVLESSDRAVAGFLAFASDAIEGLFIDPDYRGRGAGRALVAHAQRLAAGALSVDVNEQNNSARAFYERMGFVVVGQSPTDVAGRSFPILHLRREPRGEGRPRNR
jgi:putative acetyltransferase